MSIPESKRPGAVLSSPHETRLCFFQPSTKAEDGPRMYQEQAVTREIASRLRGQMLVSRWIEHAQAVVSATLAYWNHGIASEISSRFRGQMLVSQWIGHAQAVVSATLVYRNHAIASEFASQMLLWDTAVAGKKAIAMEV
jgi:hypothetical protein